MHIYTLPDVEPGMVYTDTSDSGDRTVLVTPDPLSEPSSEITMGTPPRMTYGHAERSNGTGDAEAPSPGPVSGPSISGKDSTSSGPLSITLMYCVSR